jgi:hypothetical protein
MMMTLPFAVVSGQDALPPWLPSTAMPAINRGIFPPTTGAYVRTAAAILEFGTAVTSQSAKALVCRTCCIEIWLTSPPTIPNVATFRSPVVLRPVLWTQGRG